MTAVYGYVKVKETDDPIPNLVVSINARAMTKMPTKPKTKQTDPFKLYPRSLGSAIINDK